MKKLLLASMVVCSSCAPERSGSCSSGPCSDTRENVSVRAPERAGDAGPAGFCGDGVFDPRHEQCDDGSACRDGRDCTNDRLRCQATSASACQPRSLDGCSDRCELEPGYVCREGTDCVQSSLGDLPSGVPEVPAGLPGAPVSSPPEAPASPPPLNPPGPPALAARTPVLGEPVEPPDRDPPCRRFDADPPEPLTGLDPSLDHWAPALASDGRTLFFAGSRPGGVERIFFATRNGNGNGSGNAFTDPVLVANIGSLSGDGTPFVSHDGLTLYFHSRRPGGGGGERDLWFSRRPDRAAPFPAPGALPGTNGSGMDHLPWLTADELTLLFVSTRAGGSGQADVWLARRGNRSASFGIPEPFSALNGAANDGRASSSSDGGVLFFASDREGGEGGQDLWLSVLDSDGSQFETPINLEELNGPSQELDPFLGPDERELFFASNRNGRSQLFRARLDCDD